MHSERRLRRQSSLSESSRRRRSAVACGRGLVVVLSLIALPDARAGAQLVTTGPEDSARREFEHRVEAYVQLHRTIEKGLPPLDPTADVERVLARRTALTNAIRTARNRSRPGEIFIPAVRNYFRALITASLKSRPVEEARAILSEVPRAAAVRVNAGYPESAALATIPPELLSQLPPLPPELEYRFLGKALILRDADANLVVDFVENAIPRL